LENTEEKVSGRKVAWEEEGKREDGMLESNTIFRLERGPTRQSKRSQALRGSTGAVKQETRFGSNEKIGGRHPKASGSGT